MKNKNKIEKVEKTMDKHKKSEVKLCNHKITILKKIGNTLVCQKCGGIYL